MRTQTTARREDKTVREPASSGPKTASLRERLAEKKARAERAERIRARVAAYKERTAATPEVVEAARKEAQVKAAAAWTLTKYMAPTMPADVQQRVAACLVAADTAALKGMVQQAAKNAHWTKFAEDFEGKHKVSLNDFLEEESVLNKLKGEVEKELKGDAKSASAKKADDEVPAEEAAAPAEEAAPAAEGDVAPVGDEAPAEEVSVDKDELLAKIDAAEAAVQAIEQEIVETEGDELDLTKIFDEDNIEDKKSSLANEGESFMAADEEEAGDDFFGPTGSKEMEASLDDPDEVDISEAADFFSHEGSLDGTKQDQLGNLMSRKAADVDVETGDMADHFESDLAGDDRDFESDHEDSLLFAIVDELDQAEMKQDRDQEHEPFERAASKVDRSPKKADNRNADARARVLSTLDGGNKVARAGKKPVRSVGEPGGSRKVASSDIASMLFKDEDEYLD